MLVKFAFTYNVAFLSLQGMVEHLTHENIFEMCDSKIICEMNERKKELCFSWESKSLFKFRVEGVIQDRLSVTTDFHSPV